MKRIRKKPRIRVLEDSPNKTAKLPADFYRVAEELNHVKDMKKDLEKREDELKKQLGDMLEKNCYKDSKGSFVTKIDIAGKETIVKKECRKRPKLNLERAEEFFRAHNLWDFVTEKKEVINENYVEQAVLQGKMSAKDLESITDMNTSYAIVLREYKPEEDVEGII